MGDGLESALAEACPLLDAGHAEALVILGEETPPAGYRPWIDDVPFSYALALRVRKGDDFQLRLSRREDGDAHAPWPHPLNLLRHLLLGTPQWWHPGRAAHWQWRRAS